MADEILRPIEQVLRDLGREIAAVRDLAERLEVVVEALGAHADPGQMVECQVADLLTQRLGGLALYVQTLAVAPTSALLDIGEAAAALPLRDQARRLGGDLADADDAQDLTWFGDQP